MDSSLPGSSGRGISQAGILEWVVIFFLQGIFPTQGAKLCLLPWQEGSFTTRPRDHLICGSPVSNKSSQTAFAHFVPPSHFVYSYSISEVFANMCHGDLLSVILNVVTILHWSLVVKSPSCVSDSWDPMDCNTPGCLLPSPGPSN